MDTATSNSNNNERCNTELDSKDEVDFVNVSANNNNNSNYNNKKLTAVSPTAATIETGSNYVNNKDHDNNNTTTAIDNKSTKENSVPNNNNKNQKNSNKKCDNSSNRNSNNNTCNSSSNEKRTTTRERIAMFAFNKKHSQKLGSAPKAKITEQTTSETTATVALPFTTPAIRQHKFVKSSSIARLLGNTYNAKKFEKEEQKRLAHDGKFNTYAGRRRLSGPYMERFRQCSKEDGDEIGEAAAADDCSDGADTLAELRALYGGGSGSDGELSLQHPRGIERAHEDFGSRAMRTLTRGLGRLWWRKSHSVDISTPDPEFKVSYLGNVLTGWAKGEGCVEKQLNTLWRNYTQHNKPDVIMRIKVCASGLKATTRQHGLTEYWANRITHCCAPKNYPRVFCWIYRHEGRKLKHELRCHAVLCSKERVVQDICNTLKENLEGALREFKREKILKQNARLSLANAAYENPSLPRRKILLSVGGNNYRPPLERSKSAPKLMAIEEAIGEEDGEEAEETNEPEMKSCCQKDSLYPAMTLGRRRCRRGHSIRRTGQARPAFCTHFVDKPTLKELEIAQAGCSSDTPSKEALQTENTQEQRNSYGSDDSDEFEKLLQCNNYDSANTLANELLPYFDMQLHQRNSCSLGSLSDLKDELSMATTPDDTQPLSLLPIINCNPSADPEAEYSLAETLDTVVEVVPLHVCSDGEEDFDDMYFRQAAILNMLHRNSMRKMANLSLSSDENSIDTSLPLQFQHQTQSSISSNASSTLTSVSANDNMHGTNAAVQRKQTIAVDSDEGSISSGCETASTVTANQDDTSLRYRQSEQLGAGVGACNDLLMTPHHNLPEEEPITAEEIYQRLESRRHGSDATTFSSSSSITLKQSNSPTASLHDVTGNAVAVVNSTSGNARSRRQTRRHAAAQCDDSDSECSDESGYVEELRDCNVKAKTSQAPPAKPPVPPKPMPRRHIGVVGTTTTV